MKFSPLPLITTAFALALVACVDTTGLAGTLSHVPHPKTNANAAVVVTEYSDFQCPACRGAATGIVQPLIAQYGRTIRFELKHFPLRSLHRYALEAAEAGECAGDQGKFWEFADLAYEKQPDLNSDALSEWGKELGLDMDLYERCRSSHIKRDAILAEYQEGVDKGVGGTPTFFVNGQRVETGVDTLSAAIEAAGKGLQQRL